jgi:hypothetical protein
VYLTKLITHDEVTRFDGSFRGRPASISHLAGRASQIALDTATPSGLSYGRGKEFSLPHLPELLKVGKNKTGH